MLWNDCLVDVWPEESGNRQELTPDCYIRNGSIYVVWAECLRRGILFNKSQNLRPWVMPLERSINIDTEMDLKMADLLLREND